MFSFAKKAVSSDGDWVTDATAKIESVIDIVRDNVVVKITTVARILVYGLLGAIIGVVALIIAAIVSVRILDIYLDYIPGISNGVWVADFVAGAIFVAAGLFAWSRRSPKVDREG